KGTRRLTWGEIREERGVARISCRHYNSYAAKSHFERRRLSETFCSAVSNVSCLLAFGGIRTMNFPEYYQPEMASASSWIPWNAASLSALAHDNDENSAG